MGCPPSKQKPEKGEDPSTHLIFIIRQLAIEFKIDQNRLQAETNHLIQQLRELIAQPPTQRNPEIQSKIITNILTKSHQSQIYHLLALECQCVIDRQPQLRCLLPNTPLPVSPEQQKLVSQPISTILFSVELVNDYKINKKSSDLQKFQIHLKESFPCVVAPQECRHEIINYYKRKGGISREMMREYVLTFCQEENISLQVFNAPGHDFHY